MTVGRFAGLQGMGSSELGWSEPNLGTACETPGARLLRGRMSAAFRLGLSAVLAVGFSAAVLVGPAAAAVTPNSQCFGGGAKICLVGSRTASAIIRVSARIDADPFFVLGSTRGSYFGYLISDLAGHPLVGSVEVPGYPPGESIPMTFPLAFGFRPLQPGRYVLTLIANGVTTVQLRLSGGRSFTVRPSTPVASFGRVLPTDLLAASPAGSPVSYSWIGVPAGRHVAAVVAEIYWGEDTQGGYGGECFQSIPMPCLLDQWTYAYTSPGTGQSAGADDVTFGPGDFAPGTMAVFDHVDAGLFVRHVAFVFVLE